MGGPYRMMLWSWGFAGDVPPPGANAQAMRYASSYRAGWVYSVLALTFERITNCLR